MDPDQPAAPPISRETPDNLTVAAIALVAYALANIIHEGLGHGLPAWLLGGHLERLSSVSLSYDDTGMSMANHRVVAAGGSVLNAITALLSFILMRAMDPGRGRRYYFLWLLTTVNLLQAAGYLLFSGVGNIGDWAFVVRDLQPWWLWRLILTAAGGVSYWFAMRFMLFYLGPLVGGDPSTRFRRANTLMLIPYFSGAGLYLLSGLFNPGGFLILAISAAAASLGGTSGLAWGSQLLKDIEFVILAGGDARIQRSRTWLILSLVVSLLFIFVLGPGVTFPGQG